MSGYFGGRKPGAKNKATIERERIAAEIAARTVADARTAGKKLAKEVLEEFMLLFAGMAAFHQPIAKPAGTPKGPNEDSDKFDRYAILACDTAAQLAKYQSPTFRAEHVIIDQVATRPSARVIDIKTDVIALQARYQRMIKAVG